MIGFLKILLKNVLVGKSESPDSMSKAVEIVDIMSKKMQLSPKKMSPPKPWISPAFAKKDSKDLPHRSSSLDHANLTSKTTLRPFPRQKGNDSFAMDEDADVSTGSTSDSEVVVVVQPKTRNPSPRKNLTKTNKVQKEVRKTKSLSQDEEEVRNKKVASIILFSLLVKMFP